MESDTPMADGCVYCSSCDYAISREQMLDTVDCACPRCGGASASQFYSVGSLTHIVRRKAWIRGHIKGCPPPLPQPPQQKEGGGS